MTRYLTESKYGWLERFQNQLKYPYLGYFNDLVSTDSLKLPSSLFIWSIRLNIIYLVTFAPFGLCRDGEFTDNRHHGNNKIIPVLSGKQNSLELSYNTNWDAIVKTAEYEGRLGKGR